MVQGALENGVYSWQEYKNLQKDFDFLRSLIPDEITGKLNFKIQKYNERRKHSEFWFSEQLQLQVACWNWLALESVVSILTIDWGEVVPEFSFSLAFEQTPNRSIFHDLF